MQLLEHWGYLAIFVLTVLESACIPIPSEVTLGLGGASSSVAFQSGSSTHLDLGLVIVVGIVGSVIGSLIAYVVGRTGGRRLVDRYGKYVLLTHADLDRVEAWFARRGEWMVLFGRVIPVVRTFISLPAGMAEMNPVRFVVLTTIGCAIWVSTLSVVGYEVGGQWQSVTKGFGYASYVVVAVAVVGIAAFVWHRLRAVRREAASAGSGTSGGGEQGALSAGPTGALGASAEPTGAVGASGQPQVTSGQPQVRG